MNTSAQLAQAITKCFVGLLIFSLPMCAISDSAFDKLKRELEQLGNKESEKAPAQRDSDQAQVPRGTPRQLQANQKSILEFPESWCKDQVGLLSGKKVNAGLITEEFNIKNLESLQDEFWVYVNNESSTSKALGNSKLWRSSFETRKIRGLYNAFVSYPEPDVLAAIIEVAQSSKDKQEKNDAAIALTLIHLAAPNLSTKPDRWLTLHKQAGSDNWTALVLKARLHAYGEGGVGKDLQSAMGYLVQAGERKRSASQSNGRIEWDKANWEVPYNKLAFEIVSREPEKFPAWAQLSQTLAQSDAISKELMARWPRTRAGKLSAAANELNRESEELGLKALNLSKDSNAQAGAIANIESLRAEKAGAKQTFAFIDPKVEAMVLTMMKQSSELSADQKKLLEQSQEKRLSAQGLVAQIDAELAEYIFAAAQANDLARVRAIVPARMNAQETLTQSCIFSSKWEQALRAKKVTVPEKIKASSNIEKFANLKDE